jgi:2-dehydropantoate 2-reductase
MSDVCHEGLAVAQAIGMDVGTNIMKRVVEVAHRTRDNHSSMLQSLLQNKRTEIDYINGAITKIGEQYEIPTPVNATLTNIVKALER